MTIDNKIDRFCSYFEHQSIVIGGLRSEPQDASEIAPEDHQIRFYQKVLLVTALDTLAGIRYSKEKYPCRSKRNRDRFIRFISEYSSWPSGVLVSLPFLLDDLNRQNSRGNKLFSFIKGKLDQFSTNEGILLRPEKIDERPDTLLAFARTEKEEESIWHYQHYALMYRYRNFLVHESREPGYAMEGIRHTEPEAYYHGYLNTPKWHLAYPVGLFIRIFMNSLRNMKEYLIEDEIDPYSLVGDTTRW